MAGLIIIYEAIIDLIRPHVIQKLDKGIYLVAFTAVINFIVGAICISRGKRNNSMALQAGGKHLQSDTYSTIGIIVGLVLIWFTHLAWLERRPSRSSSQALSSIQAIISCAKASPASWTRPTCNSCRK